MTDDRDRYRADRDPESVKFSKADLEALAANSVVESKGHWTPVSGYPLPSGLYLRYDLIPMDVLREVVEVFAFGQKKHVDLAQGEGQSWTAGQQYSHRVNKILRHLMAFIHGETADTESGRHHLAHAIVQVMMLLGMDMRGYTIQDDRNTMNGHIDRVASEQDTFYWSKSREETGCDLTELERGIK